MKDILQYEGHEVVLAENGMEGLVSVKSEKPDIVFCDIKMPKMEGIEVLERIKEFSADTPVIMISGHGTIDTAIEAIRKGAYDFIEKPLDLNRILITIKNATDKHLLIHETKTLKNKVSKKYDMIGNSEALNHIRAMIDKVAVSDARILVTGPNGSGKELVAHQLHELSHRKDNAFVEVNCAAIPSELIESELFGHEKGSFTSAIKQKKGKFELANGGTLFLDEIGELPLYLQAKLLRVLESNEIQKIGMSGSKYSDFRLIAATNRNLPELVDKRQFREDLYHRLNILELNLPPLRKHRGDIPSLITQLIEGICGPQKALEMRVSQDVLDLFMRYGWPGNVRELKNVLAYAYCCMDDDAVELTPRYLPERLFMGSRSEDVHAAEEPGAFSFQAMQREAEKRAIESALSLAGGNKSKAAKLLGFSRNTLYLKMKALGMGLKRK